MDVPAIARIAFTSEDRVRAVIHNFNADGFESLAPKYAGGRPPTFTLPQRREIKKVALSRPMDHDLPFSTWSLSKLAEFLVAEGVVDDISHEGLRVLLREEGVSFQVIKTFKASNDPDFETKAAEIIGLYLHPPQHAAVFCVDEKTAIQALDRKDPVLPLSPGRAERHGFEYFRHGTLSLYAAFNTKTGEVLGKTAARHTSAEFVAFLTDIVANQPRGKEIHVIADNLSAHKSQPVKDFLDAHRKVHLHFTPTYSSWLNQVELWFSKIERDVIARGVFTSVPDLKRKLMRYIRQYNKVPKTVKWKYFDPSRRITTQSAVTAH